MPTGLTAGVADGTITTLRDFALVCARQFGACIMQRDDPGNEPPKLREESPYYAKQLAEAQARVGELATMTADAAERAALADYERALEAYQRREAERAATSARYTTMLAAVGQWEPPTSEHEALKTLMRKQLAESMDFDCDYEAAAPACQTGPVWLTAQYEKAARDLAYFTKQASEECARVAGANAWITKLYESLPSAPTEVPS